MNPEERAALERLLEYVGRGFCAVQEECRMLRKYLENQVALAQLRDEFMAAVESVPIAKKRPATKQPTTKPIATKRKR